MVVWFFEFIWLLWILTSSEARTTHSGTIQAVGARSAYAGSYGRHTTRFPHGVQQGKPSNTRPRLEVKNKNEEKNLKMDFTRGISHFTADQSTTTTSRRSNNNLTAGHKNLPEIYLLVLNLATGLKNFSETSRKRFTSLLSKSLGLHEQGCVILHVLPISLRKIQVELYCEKDMVKAMGSEWEPNVFIPADKMIQTLDSPSMQPFLREFNITAYGVKDTLK
ncbi:hypothetical protein OS493_021008 [Desmophyllum pertusum]|uniref:Uncharacterized protein n=1 Tax=Desmophyllum pertusum TaxID=174260 RepID=A0A9X0D9X1_9CNID|nr:hypothetical protein OS493_021008 [Desmophyllum pertusum]